MSEVQSPPHINELSWGEVKTKDGTFKDAKLWPGGAHAWDWDETGTSHTPGIQPADVEELLEHDAEIIILSEGHEGRLQIKEETINYIEENGAEVRIYNTKKAVEKYNQLASADKPVGALIHSTC
jgi:hypothetical protein